MENSNKNTAQTNDENQNSPGVLERPENLNENTVETNDVLKSTGFVFIF